MSLKVLLSEEGHFDGLEDEAGNTVAFLVVGSDESQSIEGYKHEGSLPEEEIEEGEIEGEEDDDTDLWYPDEEVPVEMFATEVACDFCGSGDTKLQLCAACKNMSYCKDECQRKDWDRLHQHECEQEIDEQIALQLSEATQTTEDEAIAAHPSDEEYEALLIEQGGRGGGRRGGGGSAPGRLGPRGTGPRPSPGPRRGFSAPGPRRTPPGHRGGPGRTPGRRGTTAPGRRLRRDPFSPFTPARGGRRFTRPPPGQGRGFGRWRRAFTGRSWFWFGLYPWFTHWHPGYPFLYASALTYPFLYWPRGRTMDPAWYFDPFGDPREIDRQLMFLRRRYAVMISRGFEIVPDFDRGRFRWVRRRF